MTQNEKDFLLKDLCARLPYGVKVEYNGEKYKIANVSICNETITIYGKRGYPMEVEIKKVKPYFFPLSDMSKEVIIVEGNRHIATNIDWLNANHLDYRDLILKGLAIDATGKNIY